MQEHTNEELALLIRQGRTEYMAELWEQVRRLIMKMIFQLLRKRPLPAWADKEDAVQCGFFALIKAVEAYRPEDGFLLTSYLSYCVRNALNSELWGRKKEVAATSYNQPAGGEESETELLELIEDDSAPLAFEEVELTDVQQAVIEAMAALPDDMREMDPAKVLRRPDGRSGGGKDGPERFAGPRPGSKGRARAAQGSKAPGFGGRAQEPVRRAAQVVLPIPGTLRHQG